MDKITGFINKLFRTSVYINAFEQRVLAPLLGKDKFHLRQAKKNFKNEYDKFLAAGITSQEAYQLLIKLYCLSNGKNNEDYHNKITSINPPLKMAERLRGVIGDFDSTDFKKMNNRLNADGYLKFEQKLDPAICSRLYEFALKTPTKVQGYDSKIVYDPANLVNEVYRLDGQDLINNLDVQSLIMDSTLINIVRNYFGCEPIFDWPNMWWSTSFNREASSEAAQLYHFDMERIKWLKIFIYVNDVTEENGPHAYIRGSHIPGNKPMVLLKRGYARIEDQELKDFYKEDDFIELRAPSGTIIAGDTKCWHKGNLLKKGHRLMLELEYTASMFGVNRSKLIIQNTSAEFKKFCKSHKVYSSNIDFEN